MREIYLYVGVLIPPYSESAFLLRTPVFFFSFSFKLQVFYENQNMPALDIVIFYLLQNHADHVFQGLIQVPLTLASVSYLIASY